jgi:chemotaxis signal transduction protein
MLAIRAVHLLLFSEQGVSFGAHADQVKELLNVNSSAMADSAESEHYAPYKGQDLRVLRLSRRLKLQETLKKNRRFLFPQNEGEETLGRAKDAASPESPARILVIQHSKEGEIGILVECLKQLREVPLKRIFRLPPLLEKKQLFQFVWGLTLIDEQPAVLIDLEHI